VFDDLHIITDHDILQVLDFFINHLPASMMTVVTTREDSPLPLARLRARHQLLELREGDLNFTAEETGSFLRDTMGLVYVSDNAIEQLVARTEGWPSGVQLAALALQAGRVDPEDFLASFSGSNRLVADYLLNEVFVHLSPELQDFLKHTAVLDRLNASLCTALTGYIDSQTILE
jgi:LuxR family transcriptional regulator, maltose regulon positive regulatory protein